MTKRKKKTDNGYRLSLHYSDSSSQSLSLMQFCTEHSGVFRGRWCDRPLGLTVNLWIIFTFL